MVELCAGRVPSACGFVPHPLPAAGRRRTAGAPLNGAAPADGFAAAEHICTEVEGLLARLDAALSAGAALREDLERQRQTFASMVARMDAVGERVPGINRLIGQIRRKKKRDVMVMALVVATLVFLTGLWKLA